MIVAALAIAVICLVLLLLQNRRLQRLDELEKQLAQLQNTLQSSQKDDAALIARQDLLLQSVDGWLEKLQIYDRFAGVFTRTDGYAVKPNPALFEAAQQCLALPKEECLIVEDSENGTIAARNAGIPCVAIPNRMTESSDFSRAAYRCASLKALLKQLQESC